MILFSACDRILLAGGTTEKSANSDTAGKIFILPRFKELTSRCVINGDKLLTFSFLSPCVVIRVGNESPLLCDHSSFMLFMSSRDGYCPNRFLLFFR